MDWHIEIQKNKNEMINDLRALMQIKSVKDLSTAVEDAPMGAEIGKALDTMLRFCEREGFKVVNHNGYVGYAEYNPSNANDYVAILAHLDVVPAEGNWNYKPFDLTIDEGKMYGRGAIDNKGPAVSMLYALKLIKEFNLPINRSIRLIFGTDEESGSMCMEKYNSIEPQPICGFTPDSEFPVTNAEKGQLTGKIIFEAMDCTLKSVYNLKSFKAGSAMNMVAEKAEIIVEGSKNELEILVKDAIMHFEKAGVEFCSEFEENNLKIVLFGKGAHGSIPQEGVNAGIEAAHFLSKYNFEQNSDKFIKCLNDCYYMDYHGNVFGVDKCDDICGDVSVNIGIINYEEKHECYYTINLRFPPCLEYDFILNSLERKLKEYSFIIPLLNIKIPHVVPKDHPMIKVLSRIYSEETGLDATPLYTGGGTYASSVENCVAFGARFPNTPSTEHTADEYWGIDEFLKATEIIGKSIYELGRG